MKRRTTKNLVRREQRNLAITLRILLSRLDDKGLVDRNICDLLSSDVVSLLAAHLFSRPAWPKQDRWLDDINWTSISLRARILKGSGILWWGNRRHPSNELSSEPLEVEFRVRDSSNGKRFSYYITFGSGENICFINGVKK